VLRRIARRAATDQGTRRDDLQGLLSRFHPYPFCHDLEVLLLAVPDRLRARLRTSDNLSSNYRHPVEDQNDRTPPKRVVETLFNTKHHKREAYKDTVDAPAILQGVPLSSLKNPRELPHFSQFLCELEGVTGVPID